MNTDFDLEALIIKKIVVNVNYYKCYMFRIRIDLNTDPDPAFWDNTDPAPDPDSDPGFCIAKM